MAPSKPGLCPSGIPLKARLLMAAHCLGFDASRRRDGGLNRRLMNLFDPKSSPSRKPIKGVASSDITVDASRRLWFRLYTPSSSTTTLPLIVYFHGGGFALCAANSRVYDVLCRQIARQVPAVVVSVNFRRSPEHRFPSPYEDGVDVLKFIDDAQNAGFLPPETDLGRCFISGDSAGGNIAHHVAVRAGEQELKRLRISGLVLLQPFFGGEERTESELRLDGAPLLNLERTDWMWKAFLPAGSDRNHLAAKVWSADISEAKFAETLLVVGGYDPLQDWQRRYKDWLESSGKQVHLLEYPNAFHGFYGFPELPETSLLITEVAHFVHMKSSL